MNAVGVFVYAGGFMIGVRQHFNVLAHFEDPKPLYARTVKLNWPNVHVHAGPRAAWPLTDYAGRVDAVFANPPCAIFSSMGIATTRGQDAWRTDPRLSCWYDAFHALTVLRPRAFVLESVCPAYTKGREVVDELTCRGLELGYSATHLLHDARWCGVPQKRRRFFLVLHRPRHLTGWERNFAPPPTVGEVLQHVTEPGYHTVTSRSDWSTLIANTAPGDRLCTTYETLNPGCRDVRNPNGTIKGRPSFQERRLNANETMGAWIGDKFYHPTEVRRLGLEEGKALCGFSPEFSVAPEDVKGWASLLARGVMPPVGEWIARAVAATLGGADVEDRTQLTVTRVDVREPGVPAVDLTAEYLDERGRVRYRTLPDGRLVPARQAARDTLAPARPAAPRSPVVPAAPPPEPVPRAPAPRPAPLPVAAPGAPPTDEERPRQGEGSGALIRRLWLTGRYAPERLVEIVLANWPGRKTTVSDVRYNYYELVKSGTPGVPPWPTRSRQRTRRPTVSEEIAPFTMEECVDPARLAALVGSPSSRDGAERCDVSRSTPVVMRGVAPKIIVTGCTRNQAAERGPTITGVDFPLEIVRGLRELGCEVDWSAGALGAHRDADATIVSVGPVLSLPGCQHAATALWALADADAVRRPVGVVYDDWQVKVMQRQLFYVSDRFAGPPRRRFIDYAKNDAVVLDRVADQLVDVATKLTTAWPEHWTMIFPKFRNWGDPLRVVGQLPLCRWLSLDPTPVLIDAEWQPRVGTVPARSWFFPALAMWEKWLVDLRPSWPVVQVGHRSFGPKLATRADVMQVGAEHWVTLCPPYDHAGSGWFRTRYLDAALAGRVLLVDPADAETLDPVYELKISDVEQLTDAQLTEVAREQARVVLSRAVLSHEEWLTELRQLLERLGLEARRLAA